MSGGVLVWLFVWSNVQTCIWPSWCHCHSLSFASVKSRLVSPFWYRLTRVVPEKGPLNGCACLQPMWAQSYFSHLAAMNGIVSNRIISGIGSNGSFSSVMNRPLLVWTVWVLCGFKVMFYGISMCICLSICGSWQASVVMVLSCLLMTHCLIVVIAVAHSLLYCFPFCLICFITSHWLFSLPWWLASHSVCSNLYVIVAFLHPWHFAWHAIRYIYYTLRLVWNLSLTALFLCYSSLKTGLSKLTSNTTSVQAVAVG